MMYGLIAVPILENVQYTNYMLTVEQELLTGMVEGINKKKRLAVWSLYFIMLLAQTHL